MHETIKKASPILSKKLNQFHEFLKIEKKIKDTAINTINKSVKDLLIIIKRH